MNDAIAKAMGALDLRTGTGSRFVLMRAILFQILALTLIASTGCQREGAPRLPPVTIEVIPHPVQVEGAKQAWADDRERKLASLLQQPDEIRWHDKESVELLKLQRDRSVSDLSKVRDDSSKAANTRFHAILALRLLDVRADPHQLVLLGQSGIEVRRALLAKLSELYPDPEPIPDDIKNFVVTSIGHADSRVVNLAALVASSKHMEEAGDALLSRLASGSGKPNPSLLRAAAVLRPSAALLEQFQKQLKPTARALEGNDALGAIAELGKATKDPALQERAARICVDYLKQQPNQNWIDGNAMSAVDLINQVQPAKIARAMLAEL